MTANVMIDENGNECGNTLERDADKCERCGGGEFEVGFAWDKCIKCGNLKNPHFRYEQSIIRDNQNRKHGHYFKDVSKLDFIDVYAVLKLFDVTDPCLQHAIKKLLCAGQRGVKDQVKDINEAKDTLERCLELLSVGGDDA